MSDFVLSRQARLQTIGAVTASTVGTTVTASATADTKGSWVELTSATTFPSEVLYLRLAAQTTCIPTYVDIGVGAAASETVVLSNMQAPSTADGSVMRIPIRIPTGVRVAARCQATVGSSAVWVSGTLESANWDRPVGFGRCTTYGFGGSYGAVVSGGGAHTKGSWVEVTSSTTNDISHLMVAITSADTTLSNQFFMFDVGVGSAGSEVVRIANQSFHTTSGEVLTPSFFSYDVHIPAGSRIAIRHQSILTSDNVLIYMVYGSS